MNGSLTSIFHSTTRNTNKLMPQAIATLSLGDRVIFTSGIPGSLPEVAQVEKVTSTQIVVRGIRFRREDDISATAVGGGNSFIRAHIRIGGPGEIAKIAAENLKQREIAKLRNTDWANISQAKRNGIIRILNHPEN